MRPVEYETKDIIQAGLELQALSRKVSGFSLRQKIGGGNTKRLMQVWEEYLTSQTFREAEPVTELPSEIAEAFRVVVKALTKHLSGLAIDLNDKAVKAAEHRVKEVISSADDQREQAEQELADASQTIDDLKTKIDELKVNAEKLEKKLADAQAVNQSQTMELAKLQERLALTEQTAKTVSEQHSAELTGQLEATKAPTAEPMQVLSSRQTGIKNKEIDSLRFSAQSSHQFQTNAVTHSILKLPLIPVNVATLWW